MYVCGITPYDATHIGHAATYVAFDLLNRAWRNAGHEVALRPERHRRRRPAARAGRQGRRRLGRAGRARDRAVPAGHDGAAGAAADALRRRGRVDPAGRRPDRAAPGGRRGLPGRGRPLLLGHRRPGVRRGVRAGPASEMLEIFPERGGDPDRAGQEGPARLRRLARRAAGRAGLGQPVRSRPPRLAHRVLGDRPATSSARRSTCRAAAATWSSRTTRCAPARPRSRPGSAVRAGLRARRDGRPTTARRCRSPAATWSSSRALRNSDVDPMAIRLALLRHHYRSDWEWDDAELWDAVDTLAAVAARASRCAPAPRPAPVVDEVLAALADDLDAPRACAAVDAWVDATLGAPATWPTPATPMRPMHDPTRCSTPRSGSRSELVEPSPAHSATVGTIAGLSGLQVAGWRRRPAPAQSLVVAALEVPLELAGDRLAGGLGELGGVAGLLERPDVLGDVLVLLGELVDAALPGAGVLGQVAERDAAPRAGPRAGRAGRAWPWGRAAARRSAAPRPSRTRPGCRAGRRRPGRRRRCRSGPSYVDCSSLSRSTSSGSVAVPVTGIGRVCGVSASSAPRVTTSWPPRSSAGGEQLGAELPPAHVRLDAADQDDVAVAGRAGWRSRSGCSAR